MPHAVTIALQAEGAQEGACERLDVAEIYARHAQAVRALLVRMLGSEAEAEDVLQEVFVIAWRRLRDLRGKDPLPWLCGIAVRLCARMRRRARVRAVLERLFLPETTEWRTPERRLELDEASRVLFAVLDRLSEKKRTVFILYELQELSGPEIASALGCPLKTVWSRLGHARREFAAQLERLEAGSSPVPDPTAAPSQERK